MRQLCGAVIHAAIAVSFVATSACHNNPAVKDKASDTTALRPDTTICEIASKPERFVGKRVVVAGCITSDGFEHIALTQADQYCDAGGLSPGKSPHFNSPQWFYPRPDEKACGIFAGVFRGSDLLQVRVLEIDGAQNVHIVPLVP